MSHGWIALSGIITKPVDKTDPRTAVRIACKCGHVSSGGTFSDAARRHNIHSRVETSYALGGDA